VHHQIVERNDVTEFDALLDDHAADAALEHLLCDRFYRFVLVDADHVVGCDF